MWRETFTSENLEPGQIMPLPEFAMNASSWELLPEAEVAGCFSPDQLPAALMAALKEEPGPGCRMVLELQALKPEADGEGHVLIGQFDHTDARRVIARLEADGVPFQMELDREALTRPGRADTMFLIPQAPVACLRLWVPVSDFPHSQKIVRWVLPAEPGAATSASSAAPSPPAVFPSLEIYTPPTADLRSPSDRGRFLQ